MPPWHLLDELQLAKVSALKTYFDDKVATAVSSFIQVHGQEHMDKVHDSFCEISSVLATSEDATSRWQKFRELNWELGDSCNQLIKYMSGESNVVFYDGLVRLVAAIEDIGKIKDGGDLCGHFSASACQTIYRSMQSLGQYMECTAAADVMKQKDVESFGKLKFVNFSLTFQRAYKFCAEVYANMQKAADMKADSIAKSIRACHPTPETMANEQILDDSELHQLLLDAEKRDQVPHLMCKAAEFRTALRNLQTSCGCSLINQARMDALAAARADGRMAVGLSFLIDHLHNKMPAAAKEVPAWAKQVHGKLLAKKIPLPSFAVARLRRLQESC